MSSNPVSGQAPLGAQEVLQLIRELRQQGSQDEAFWPRLAMAFMALSRARACVLLRLQSADEVAVLAQAGQAASLQSGTLQAHLGTLLPRAREQGFATQPTEQGDVLACIRLTGLAQEAFALLEIPGRERTSLNELLLRAQLVADWPRDAAASSLVLPAEDAANPGASTPDLMLRLLDLVASVMQEDKAGAAALALVNGLVALLSCDQAVLGWHENGYVHAWAISHLDRFERKAETVQMFESAMEESLDQQSDIAYPPAPDDATVMLSHERLARGMHWEQVHSLILRRGDEAPQGVVLLGAAAAGLSSRDLHQVSVAMHLVLPWLADMHARDQWMGAKLKRQTQALAQRWLGPDRPLRTAGVIAGAVVLMVLLVGTWPHRLDSNAELVTDSTQIISAPFDGYVAKVRVSMGDEVRAGDELGSLDVSELFLQEAEARADLKRFETEADLARAQGKIAEVEIARARVSQAQARLDKVLFQLNHASVKAPFNGVVVEGDRRDLSGQPVRQGERLFRVARVEGLYATLSLPEREVRFIEPNARGTLRLLSEPDRGIPFEVRSLVPIGQVVGQKGSHFMIRVELLGPPQPWWRPGLSGMAYIEAGRKNIAWLLSHRLIDFIRLQLWI